MSEKNICSVSLRIEQELIDRYKHIAKENRRSLNSQICVFLEEWIKEPKDETNGEKNEQ